MTTTNPFDTPRKRVWRNLMVAAINEGLSLGRIDLTPQDDDDQHQIEPWSVTAQGFTFEVTADHIGFGEIAVRVTFNAASPLVARGWLERQYGRYLQTTPSKLGCLHRLPSPIYDAFKDVEIIPAGYADQGRIDL